MAGEGGYFRRPGFWGRKADYVADLLAKTGTKDWGVAGGAGGTGGGGRGDIVNRGKGRAGG